MRWMILGALSLTMAGCGQYADMQACDEALKDKLKAPSTYKRIEVAENYQAGDAKYTITYDAENGFGAPLRGEGLCYLSADREDVKAFP